jgi:iron-sulfur cluster repair protein YtfE (RIC family)
VNNIFDILKKEHDKTKELFKQTESKREYRGNVFSQIRTELTIHMDGEERLLYPVLKEKEPTRDKTLEGWEEHTYIKIVLNDLVGMPREDERWQAKLTVLREMVEHHIEDEEKNLFKKAKMVISKEQADQIGTDYTRGKQKIAGSMQ